ncbi:MAG: flippase [Candidatus Brocadiaceae bacterium]|nr:flippase [Candidatus Brocadiaceae bacterium]
MTETLSKLSDDSANSDAKKVIKGAGISFFGTVTGRCLFFVSQVIIARCFSPEVFGLYILGQTVSNITALFARLGLHSGAMRFVSIYRKDDIRRLKGVLLISPLIPFLNGILLGGLVYFFADKIAVRIFQKQELTDIIKNFVPCIPFIASTAVIAMASRGFHTAKHSMYINDIIQPVTNISFLILFIKLGYGIFGVVLAFVLSCAMANFVGIFIISRRFSRIKTRDLKPIYEAKKLLNYSIPFLFNGFLVFTILWANTFMLGYMKTFTDVAIYRAASQISVFLTLILTAFTSIYAPAVADLYHRGEMERLNNIFKTTTRWIFLLVLPAALILIISAKEIMIIFGREYVEAGKDVLRILTIAQFVNCLTGGVAFTLTMTGRQKTDMVNILGMALINIALNYFLIPHYGSFGAAISTGVSIGIINLARLLEVYLIYKIHPYDLRYIQGVACGAISLIILYALNKYILIEEYLLINNFLLNHIPLTRLVSNILVVVVIFVAGFIIKGIEEEDRLILATITKKFKKMRVSRA